MAEYLEFYNRYKDKLNIFIVYISEAHFVEENGYGWAIGYNYRIPQHKTLEERIVRAKQLRDEFAINIPMFIDNMGHSFNLEYGAWPDMLYYITNNKVVFFGELEEGGIRRETFSSKLERMMNNNQI